MIFIYYDKQISDIKISKFLNLTNFGDIHIGKRSLRNTFSDLITPRFKFRVINDLSKLSEINEPYILWSSDIVSNNWDKVLILCDKLIHSSDNVEVNCGTSSLIFVRSKEKEITLTLNREEFLKQIRSIHDLTNLTQENLLYRYFNRLKVDGKKIVKESFFKEKIKAEYNFLSSVPETLRSYFVEVSDYKESSELARYSMQKYEMVDSSILYINGGLNGKDLSQFLEIIGNFLENRLNFEDSSNKNNINSLLIEKVHERSKKLKEWDGFNSLDKFIFEHTSYRNFDEIIEQLYKTVKKQRIKLFKYKKIFSHGDLCLSNILYDKNSQFVKLVDPKGGDHAYLPSIYDFAKLSHSILGGYDHIINNRSAIAFNSSMVAESDIKISLENVELFKAFLNNLNVSYEDVRLVEASLFLSMLPLHTDDKRKVILLAIRGMEILNEVK